MCLIFCLLLAGSLKAQNFNQISKRIDSLTKVGLPKSALKEAQEMERLAALQNNTPQHIKAILYRIRFQSVESVANINNVTDNLKKNIASAAFPEKNILQSILAGIYARYYTNHFYEVINKPKLAIAAQDVADWDAQTLWAEINKQYSASLNINTAGLQTTRIDQFKDVLEGDSSNRSLRPTLYDLLLHQALDFYLSAKAAFTVIREPFSLNNLDLFADSQKFASIDLKTADTTLNTFQAIKYLQQGTKFHLKRNDAEAIADLDIKRLIFLHSVAILANNDQLYTDGLLKIADVNANLPISADANTLLGEYYVSVREELKGAGFFDKAIKAFPNSLGGKNAATSIKALSAKQVYLAAEAFNLPGKPLLGYLQYANIGAAQVKIYKLSTSQFADLQEKREAGQTNFSFNLSSGKTDPTIVFISKLNPIRIQTLKLPGEKDYKTHTNEFKIDPLERGNYVMTVQDTSKAIGTPSQFIIVKITGLDCKVRMLPNSKINMVVVARDNGRPLKGVKATSNGLNPVTITDKNGQCVSEVDNSGYDVHLTTANDTLYLSGRYTYGYTTRPETPKQPRILFFTDREIYRPGQTVYFKGIKIQEDRDSFRALPGEKVTLTAQQGKGLTMLSFTTNQFGSFSGSYVVPNSTGFVTFSVPELLSKYVQVEEYKRPAFYVELLPFEKSYHTGDSVKLRGQITAYSGYGISNAKVVLNVNKELMFNDYREQYANRFNQRTADNNYPVIRNDTVMADSKGLFTISFKASSVTGFENADVRYEYTITADASDGNGEVRSTRTVLKISRTNFGIVDDFPRSGNATDTIKSKIWLSDLNGVKQNGEVSLSVYSLNQPAIATKARQWQLPEFNLMDSAIFKKNFSDFAYKTEDQKVKWSIKQEVVSLKSSAGKVNPAYFNVAAMGEQPTGWYKVIIKGKNADGDTASVSKYLFWVNKPGKPLADMSVILTSYYKVKGKNAGVNLYLGGSSKGYALIETYQGTAIVNTQWVKLPKGNQVTVQIPFANKNSAAQVLFVLGNRTYTAYVTPLADAKPKLNIKLLTFRNKLYPGQAEQWKLQIEADGKPVKDAEMTADLYDSSVDAAWINSTWSTRLGDTYYRQHYFEWEDEQSTDPLSFFMHSPFYTYLGKSMLRRYERLMLLDYNKYDTDARLMRETRVGGGIGRIILKMDTAEYNPNATKVRLSGRDFFAPVTLRKNFAETAFFYPQLHPDENGQVAINFTIPESLTKWRFKALVHTKDMQMGYIEQDVLTQKQLSITARMPRFLRAGDTITVSALVANLTQNKLTGNVKLRLFDGLTMKQVSLLTNPADSIQTIGVSPVANTPVSFRLVIPAGSNALTYRLTVEGGDFTDGEENTLPVLQNQTLVTESLPMMVRGGQTKAFSLDKLLNQYSTTLKNKTLTLEYTQNPAWNAVASLPYLMEYASESSDQLFNRYYANNLAANLINTMPVIKQVLERWKLANSNALQTELGKNPELKTTLLAESPWLRDAQNEVDQRKRLALLFDLNQMTYNLNQDLSKLAKMQLPGGGFAWFGNNAPDPYISTNILAGIGQLYQLHIADDKNMPLRAIKDKALSYIDQLLIKNATTDKTPNAIDIYGYYARSFFTDKPARDTSKALLNAYLDWAAKQWVNQGIYQQGLIALTMLRNNRPDVTRSIIKSLNETAQRNDEMGMYWLNNRQGYYWYQSPIETQSLMIELFTEAGDNDMAVEEMKIWLLRNKQTNSWSTGKATVAACYALLMKNSDIIETIPQTEIKIGDKSLKDLKPGIEQEAGTGYIKTSWTDNQIKPSMAKVTIANKGNNISWGALHWQYLENLDKINSSKTDIQLQCKYYIERPTKNGPILVEVDDKNKPKVGDLLKVQILLRAGRDYEYIAVKDLRPSGAEPVDVLSAYKYQTGLSYYQVTKDVATNFFISKLNKGAYTISYQLRVSQPGNFATGISTLQCMYAPEFNSHSEGKRIVVTP